MERKFRYIKYATYAAKFGLGGFTRNQQPLTIKTKHVSHTDRTKAERAQEEDAEQDTRTHLGRVKRDRKKLHN